VSSIQGIHEPPAPSAANPEALVLSDRKFQDPDAPRHQFNMKPRVPQTRTRRGTGSGLPAWSCDAGVCASVPVGGRRFFGHCWHLDRAGAAETAALSGVVRTGLSPCAARALVLALPLQQVKQACWPSAPRTQTRNRDFLRVQDLLTIWAFLNHEQPGNFRTPSQCLGSAETRGRGFCHGSAGTASI
jgi:hypothetical protein